MHSLSLMEAARETARDTLRNLDWYSVYEELGEEFSIKEIEQILDLVTTAEPMFAAGSIPQGGNYE